MTQVYGVCGSLVTGCSPGQCWVRWPQNNPIISHSSEQKKSHVLAGLKCSAWPSKQKILKTASILELIQLSSCTYWLGQALTASSAVGCWNNSALLPIGCLEESGRSTHPVLPLWQNE